MSGGIGRAVIGGVLAGDTGAIVGASTRPSKGIVNFLKIRIVLEDILEPYAEVNIIFTKTERCSLEYKNAFQSAQEIYSTIISIINSTKQNQRDESDQLRKYKKLLDDGIISQEEFEFKKKELLGL